LLLCVRWCPLGCRVLYRARVLPADKDVLPKVKVIISAGRNNEDVVIKVADEGGGIARSAMPRIWSYFFTTFPANFSRWADEDSSDFSTDTPLAGLGYGLPLSRLYARYFGGDLQVISMEGFGTDAYIHLKNVGDAMEPLYDCSNSSSSDDESIDDVIRGLSSNH
jgi:K+-sensing histidine kinase KdpD